MNSKDGLLALLQPANAPSKLVEKVPCTHIPSKNLQFVLGVFSHDCLLYDEFLVCKLWDNHLFESSMFAIYFAAKVVIDSLYINFECTRLPPSLQLCNPHFVPDFTFLSLLYDARCSPAGNLNCAKINLGVSKPDFQIVTSIFLIAKQLLDIKLSEFNYLKFVNMAPLYLFTQPPSPPPNFNKINFQPLPFNLQTVLHKPGNFTLQFYL